MAFLGKADLRFCSGQNKEQDLRIRDLDTCLLKDDDCRMAVSKMLREHHAKGHDVVISKESISAYTSMNHSRPEDRELFWSRLNDALRGWNVTIVIAYRRYFEWLVSAKNQYDYHMHLMNKYVSRNWPSHQLASMGDYLTQVLDDGKAPPYPYVHVMLNYSYPSGWNICLINFHSDDVVADFLCKVVQAKASCEEYQPAHPKRVSPSGELLYHRLNVQAFLFGWMKQGGKRYARARQTRHQAETVTSGSHITKEDCPSKDLLTRLLAQSLKYEKDIFGEEDVAAHTQAFWKGAADRFCTVNASKVLLQDKDSWRQYYESLH